ncbi:MAG: glycosyltransferase [Candidatus Paceibacterota bacterium]|jgi:glycosyltransferase involved in cell wall biosynthesis
MKLLICTQVVDAKDSDLGFFVRWIEEFAKQCKKVTVICLRSGKYSLPDNVEVIVLDKESRISRTIQLWRICISRRKEYDTVFVHMNPEYIIVAGLLWRFMQKRIALWYTHKSVNLKLRIAVLFSHKVFTASKESFRLRTKKLQVMGHGIDVGFFFHDASIVRGDWMFSVGRLMPSKRHDLAIRMAAKEGNELRIAGEGPERQHLEVLARELGARVRFLGALNHSQIRDEYRKANYLIHTSETGSLDKVVLEALACGLPVRTSDPALKMLESESSEYVRENHSLQKLIPEILKSMQTI